jgi:hypothetical protein
MESGRGWQFDLRPALSRLMTGRRVDSMTQTEAVALLSLVKTLHGAAADAERGGFSKMALVLDERGFDVAQRMSARWRAGLSRCIERAVTALETWTILADW